MNRTDLIKTLLAKHVPKQQRLHLTDIGSMGGLEAEWKSILDELNVLGLEPDEREFKKLSSIKNHEYINAAAWSKSQDLTLYVSQVPGKTSVYQPNFKLLSEFADIERFKTTKKVQLKAKNVHPLDDLMRLHAVGEADFIKLDTQGSELEILKGATQQLKENVLGIKIEVEFMEIYKNQPLFSNIDSYLKKFGFDLIDLKRTFWKKNICSNFQGKGQLAFADALYFKNENCFFEKNPSVSKIIKFLCIALLYGQYDTAMSTLEKGFHLHKLEDTPFKRIKLMLYDFMKTQSQPSFRGRQRVSVWLGKLSRNFHRSYLGWADSDACLGNRYLDQE